jgi:hypothetical protein
MAIHLFFLPGDTVLWLVFSYWPSLALFLELSHSAFGGVESAVLSAGGWLLMILVVGTLHSGLVRLGWAIRAYVVGIYREGLRRTRVGKLLVAYRVRGCTRQRAEPEIRDFPSEVDLNATDLEVLSLHRQSDAELALGIREIAASLGVPVKQAQGAVDKLKRLELLANRMDEKSSYRLTRPGHLFLVSREMIPTG